MGPKTQVLVVANRTAESDELIGALCERAERDDVRFTLLVPATPHGVAWAADMHSGSEEAEAHMNRAIDRLRALGLDVDGSIGDPDPVAAVQDLVNAGNHFDEVVVSTLPVHLSRWLKLDLPHRVERSLGLPVRHVEAEEPKVSAGG